ncbi:MAG: sulfur transferase domain-containing protein [Nostoc sp. LLA-1]|nr:sulfur transferase domain-containing protein [Cyanocohniella sp. LLY]
MTNIKQVSQNFSSAGQISVQDLEQASQAGFKSVLNLRSPDEEGFVNDEPKQAKASGLDYANVPISSKEANPQVIEQVIQEIENLPQPILVHCAGGGRATAIALIATATNEGWNNEQIKAKAQELNLKLEHPYLQQFLQDKAAI